MKIQYHLLLAMILSLTAACQDGSSSKGNDDDITEVTDDCYFSVIPSDCTCGDYEAESIDLNIMGPPLSFCSDMPPRTAVELNPDTFTDLAMSYVDYEYYDSKTMQSKPGFIGDFWLNSCSTFIHFTVSLPYEIDEQANYPVHVGVGDRRSSRTCDPPWLANFYYNGCGQLNAVELDMEAGEIVQISASVDLEEACNTGSPVGESGLPTAVRVSSLSFTTDKVASDYEGGEQ